MVTVRPQGTVALMFLLWHIVVFTCPSQHAGDERRSLHWKVQADSPRRRQLLLPPFCTDIVTKMASFGTLPPTPGPMFLTSQQQRSVGVLFDTTIIDTTSASSQQPPSPTTSQKIIIPPDDLLTTSPTVDLSVAPTVQAATSSFTPVTAPMKVAIRDLRLTTIPFGGGSTTSTTNSPVAASTTSTIPTRVSREALCPLRSETTSSSGRPSYFPVPKTVFYFQRQLWVPLTVLVEHPADTPSAPTSLYFGNGSQTALERSISVATYVNPTVNITSLLIAAGVPIRRRGDSTSGGGGVGGGAEYPSWDGVFPSLLQCDTTCINITTHMGLSASGVFEAIKDNTTVLRRYGVRASKVLDTSPWNATHNVSTLLMIAPLPCRWLSSMAAEVGSWWQENVNRAAGMPSSAAQPGWAAPDGESTSFPTELWEAMMAASNSSSDRLTRFLTGDGNSSATWTGLVASMLNISVFIDPSQAASDGGTSPLPTSPSMVQLLENTSGIVADTVVCGSVGAVKRGLPSMTRTPVVLSWVPSSLHSLPLTATAQISSPSAPSSVSPSTGGVDMILGRFGVNQTTQQCPLGSLPWRRSIQDTQSPLGVALPWAHWMAGRNATKATTTTAAAVANDGGDWWWRDDIDNVTLAVETTLYFTNDTTVDQPAPSSGGATWDNAANAVPTAPMLGGSDINRRRVFVSWTDTTVGPRWTQLFGHMYPSYASVSSPSITSSLMLNGTTRWNGAWDDFGLSGVTTPTVTSLTSGGSSSSSTTSMFGSTRTTASTGTVVLDSAASLWVLQLTTPSSWCHVVPATAMSTLLNCSGRVPTNGTWNITLDVSYTLSLQWFSPQGGDAIFSSSSSFVFTSNTTTSSSGNNDAATGIVGKSGWWDPSSVNTVIPWSVSGAWNSTYDTTAVSQAATILQGISSGDVNTSSVVLLNSGAGGTDGSFFKGPHRWMQLPWPSTTATCALQWAVLNTSSSSPMHQSLYQESVANNGACVSTGSATEYLNVATVRQSWVWNFTQSAFVLIGPNKGTLNGCIVGPCAVGTPINTVLSLSTAAASAVNVSNSTLSLSAAKWVSTTGVSSSSAWCKDATSQTSTETVVLNYGLGYLQRSFATMALKFPLSFFATSADRSTWCFQSTPIHPVVLCHIVLAVIFLFALLRRTLGWRWYRRASRRANLSGHQRRRSSDDDDSDRSDDADGDDAGGHRSNALGGGLTGLPLIGRLVSTQAGGLLYGLFLSFNSYLSVILPCHADCVHLHALCLWSHLSALLMMTMILQLCTFDGFLGMMLLSARSVTVIATKSVNSTTGILSLQYSTESTTTDKTGVVGYVVLLGLLSSVLVTFIIKPLYEWGYRYPNVSVLDRRHFYAPTPMGVANVGREWDGVTSVEKAREQAEKEERVAAGRKRRMKEQQVRTLEVNEDGQLMPVVAVPGRPMQPVSVVGGIMAQQRAAGREEDAQQRYDDEYGDYQGGQQDYGSGWAGGYDEIDPNDAAGGGMLVNPQTGAAMMSLEFRTLLEANVHARAKEEAISRLISAGSPGHQDLCSHGTRALQYVGLSAHSRGCLKDIDRRAGMQRQWAVYDIRADRSVPLRALKPSAVAVASAAADRRRSSVGASPPRSSAVTAYSGNGEDDDDEYEDDGNGSSADANDAGAPEKDEEEEDVEEEEEEEEEPSPEDQVVRPFDKYEVRTTIVLKCHKLRRYGHIINAAIIVLGLLVAMWMSVMAGWCEEVPGWTCHSPAAFLGTAPQPTSPQPSASQIMCGRELLGWCLLATVLWDFGVVHSALYPLLVWLYRYWVHDSTDIDAVLSGLGKAPDRVAALEKLAEMRRHPLHPYEGERVEIGMV